MIRIISKLLDLNQREIARLEKIVASINKVAPDTQKLKKEDFAKRTEAFKKKIKKGESLESILPEAFALVQEASWRAIGQRHFDVQLMAATALFEGKIVEQKTGEGKTLTAVAPLYLRALAGHGVHLVTVNDYLARIGAGWNGPIFDLLGMSVGVVVQEQKSYVYDPKYSDKSHGDERLEHLRPCERKEAYAADITYGTNNEYGFDYLRDNMVQKIEDMVQREHYFAIVDEVDSILIDEARTPLIISAPDTEPTDKYYKFAGIIGKLKPEIDYTIDEKSRSASLSEKGIITVEKILGIDNLYEKDWDSIHHIENALRARSLYLKDRDYVIKDGQVVIVDEFTGRLMVGRRWSDGLHQAVEAKENVTIQQESKTLATISFQNYFRMYSHLAGMTGTAATEADEFKKIYKLEVVVVPTNKPMVRKDHSDVIYKTLQAKYAAIAKDADERRRSGQPVLIGTTSIEKNEIISNYLKKAKVPHNVLNAKNHEKEASIIADAGKPGAVTVATNMAGRGVDIILGGAFPEMLPGKSYEEYKRTKEYKLWEVEHEKVITAGGLHVTGTERHESRRIDNQLRGRSGRQGDPGSTRFYLSLEDDLLRIFGGEQIGGIMNRLKIPEDLPIEHGLVSRAIEQAQGKVESFNFDTRKRLVEFDDVANQQRDIIYKLRKRILESKNSKEEVEGKLKHQIERIVLSAESENGGFDEERILVGFLEVVPFDVGSKEGIKKEIGKRARAEEIQAFLESLLESAYSSREKDLGASSMRQIEKFAYISSIDHLWMDHIDHIEGLRQSVSLRAYGQRDPLVEFKNEAFDLFEKLVNHVDEELAHRLFRIGIARPMPEVPLTQIRTNVDKADMTGLTPPGGVEPGGIPHPKKSSGGGDILPKTSPLGTPYGANLSKGNVVPDKKAKKIGRNDPCWCGSGKKWKKCHYPHLSS